MISRVSWIKFLSFVSVQASFDGQERRSTSKRYTRSRLCPADFPSRRCRLGYIANFNKRLWNRSTAGSNSRREVPLGSPPSQGSTAQGSVPSNRVSPSETAARSQLLRTRNHRSQEPSRVIAGRNFAEWWVDERGHHLFRPVFSMVDVDYEFVRELEFDGFVRPKLHVPRATSDDAPTILRNKLWIELASFTTSFDGLTIYFRCLTIYFLCLTIWFVRLTIRHLGLPIRSANHPAQLLLSDLLSALLLSE